MRDSYKNAGPDCMDDAKMLEMYLSLIIPRKDVRQIAYDLIRAFGSLSGVFSADVDQLMTVSGIGENTAVLINLTRDINQRISSNKNESIKVFNTYKDAVNYARNELQSYSTEHLMAIAVDNLGRPINYIVRSSSGVNFMESNPKEIVSFLLKCNAAGVVIAHNHPKGRAVPSASDINFTVSFKSMMDNLNLTFLDHVIIGEDEGFSMRYDGEYDFFK